MAPQTWHFTSGYAEAIKFGAFRLAVPTSAGHCRVGVYAVMHGES
jgi:hypothetical protein